MRHVRGIHVYGHMDPLDIDPCGLVNSRCECLCALQDRQRNSGVVVDEDVYAIVRFARLYQQRRCCDSADGQCQCNAPCDPKRIPFSPSPFGREAAGRDASGSYGMRHGMNLSGACPIGRSKS